MPLKMQQHIIFSESKNLPEQIHQIRLLFQLPHKLVANRSTKILKHAQNQQKHLLKIQTFRFELFFEQLNVEYVFYGCQRVGEIRDAEMIKNQLKIKNNNIKNLLCVYSPTSRKSFKHLNAFS